MELLIFSGNFLAVNKSYKGEKMDVNKKVVLQKYISLCGFGSRRKAEELIKSGRVKINGKVAELGMRADFSGDKVFVDGKKIELKEDKNYYIMPYKPRGYVTTMNDEKGRKCVADLVKDIPDRVYPVGRLDKDSEGLLIMTNDGDFANNLIHPSKNIWKKYRVTVRPGINEEQLTKLCVGIEIDSGKTAPAQVDVVTEEKERAVLEISITEGKNRQIRKMCEAVGLEVARLKRVAIGTLKLGMLKPGRWRDLTESELKSIQK